MTSSVMEANPKYWDFSRNTMKFLKDNLRSLEWKSKSKPTPTSCWWNCVCASSPSRWQRETTNRRNTTSATSGFQSTWRKSTRTFTVSLTRQEGRWGQSMSISWGKGESPPSLSTTKAMQTISNMPGEFTANPRRCRITSKWKRNAFKSKSRN